MHHCIRTIAALAVVAAGTGMSVADAAPYRHSRHAVQRQAVQHHAARQAPATMQGYAYAPRAYDNGFNPVAPLVGVLGAAATVAAAPVAIVTGNAPFGYEYGYAPGYGAPYGYGYGYDQGRGWPKRGPFYETW